jgi:hypothetical protein
MITADQIRVMIQQLTLFKITLDDFEERLTAASWDMHKDSQDDAVRMVGNIELWLAEFDAEQKNRSDLLKNLEQLAGLFSMGDSPSPAALVGSASVASFPFTGQFELLADAGKRYEVGFSYTPLLRV